MCLCMSLCVCVCVCVSVFVCAIHRQGALNKSLDRTLGCPLRVIVLCVMSCVMAFLFDGNGNLSGIQKGIS